ncbi:MAG: helix-turn-helix transcriptional regulator [Flavobacteriales bacterium]|nr:helix-turn-helix transcriptional regulator [Flavobacteriales bacterium]
MLTDDEFLFQLGAKIEELGSNMYKTQTEFSEACEIDTRTLRRIIKAEQNPTILVLRKIAKALDSNLDELVKLDS